MFLSRSDDAVIRVHNGRVDPVQTREDEPQSDGRTLLPNLRRYSQTCVILDV
jgi:hypothetical protein